MTQKITIPQQNQPFRRQSSLGGNVSFRDLGGTDDSNYVVMAIVTKVYYKQGRVDFKLTNSTNHIVTEAGDGKGSAPIPVDFYGYQRNGKIFGHYRPIQVGDLIAVAYLWGHKQAPIVLGVYPKNSSSYEFVAPQGISSSGDDKDEATYDYALGDQKIFPDGSLEYHSGNGKYFKTLRGKSFMLLDDSPLYEHLWVGYNDIGAFKGNDQKTIYPLQEKAGDWLLVHEDSGEGSNSTDHRTRFYVKKDGTFQIVLSKSSSLDDLVILEGSKSEGITLQQLYNVPQRGWTGEEDPHKDPDLNNAQQYVKFNLGGPDHSVTIEAATKDDSVEQATKLEIKDDGLYLNGKPFSETLDTKLDSLSKDIKDQITSSDDWKNFQDTIDKARSEASDAAAQAKQAGDEATAAGVSAEAAGTSALKTGDEIKKRIIYYASISNEKDIAIPGKYIIVNTDTYIAKGTIKNAYIEDGAIDHAKIADEAVWSSQIANAAITNAQIASEAVDTAQIKDLAVTDAKIGSLSADKITTGTLDAGKITVINLNAKSITAGTITADKLKIGQLSDITGDVGEITKGHIQAGDDPNSGVVIDNLDADNPNKYTPAKKAFLRSEVNRLDSAAQAIIDFCTNTGNDCSAVVNAKKSMDEELLGLPSKPGLLTDMSSTTEFKYTDVIDLENSLQSAIDDFHEQLNEHLGKTADGKNSIYRGPNEPQDPHTNDIWMKTLDDGTHSILVWDGENWINPGLADIEAVQSSLSNLPKSYYQKDEPVGDTFHDGDTWFKISTDTTNNTVVYTPFKWNHNTNKWVPMLDASSSHNYVGSGPGSAPASPIEGDFWMDNTTLKQYQNGVWKTIPTQGPQGVPGATGNGIDSTVVTYQASNSGTNVPSDTWSTSIPKATAGQYVWTKTVIGYTDGTSSTSYSVGKIGETGADGSDGADGKDGVGISNTEVTYQLSTSGTIEPTGTWSSSVLSPTTANPYLWVRTVLTYSDGSTKTLYTISVKGDTGEDGVSTYVWIMYSTADSMDNISSDNMSNQPVGANYLGLATGKTSSNESTIKDDYKWTKIKGDQGFKGTPGADGKTPYVHIAYANSIDSTDFADGSSGFTTDGTLASQATAKNKPYQYRGTYVDYNSTSSSDPTMYTWTMVYDKSKKRNFISTPTNPYPTTPYSVGDTWTQSGATYFCTNENLTGSFTASDWTMQQLTIASLDSDVANGVRHDNLLTGTAKCAFPLNSNGGTQTIQKYDDETNYIQHTSNTPMYNMGPWWPLTPEVGQVYTLSADVCGNGYIQGEFRYEGGDVGSLGRVDLTNNWQRISNTFRINMISGNWVIYANNSTLLKVKNIKIEKGSIATPWCLSQSEITTTTGDYKGVTLNDEGLTATAGSTTVAMNSNDGFLINKRENGQLDQVFRVDTSGNLTMTGTLDGVDFSGNTLTLNTGMKILNSGSIYMEGVKKDNNNVETPVKTTLDTNGLNIVGAGLSISNNDGTQTAYLRQDGTFVTNQGQFTGDVYATSLTLTEDKSGKEPSIDVSEGRFHVDYQGNVTANSFTSTGKINFQNSNLTGDVTATFATIYGGTIIGGTVNGGTINGGSFLSTKRESAIGTYYPISNSTDTPSFFVSDDGTISVHTTFPRSFSLATGIVKPKDPTEKVGPVFKVNEAFDHSTLAGSIGYGKGYDYPVPYLYGQQGGMESYPVETDELSIVWLNDVTEDTLSKSNQSYCDNYRYTQIASVSGITSDYESKVGRIKINFGIVDSYGEYDVGADDFYAGGLHDLILVLTTGPINEGDLYHVDPQMAYFNNMNNAIEIKMVPKKVLSSATGYSYYNLYGELSTQDLGPADTYYLGVLQRGFLKSGKADPNRTWKIQIDNLDVVPDGNIESDQVYYMPRPGEGSYRELAISPNGSIITHRSQGILTNASEYNAEYITFSSSVAVDGHGPYWTTVNSDGIGFSIRDNSDSQDSSGHNNGLETRQCIYFSGDNNRNGISFDNYGNIHGQVDSAQWSIFGNNGNSLFTVDLGIGTMHLSANSFRTDYDTEFYIDGKDGSGGSANLHIKQLFQQSQLSKKTNVSEIEGNDAFGKIMGVKEYNYQYKTDLTSNLNSDYVNSSIIIDDVHDTPLDKYKVPNEFMSEDKTGRNDAAQLAYLTTAFQYYVNKTDKLINRLNDKIKQLEKE